MADTFEDWLKVVDRFLVSRARGVRVDQLDRQALRIQFDSGMSPIEAATVPNLSMAQGLKAGTQTPRSDQTLIGEVRFPEYALVMNVSQSVARTIAEEAVRSVGWTIDSNYTDLIEVSFRPSNVSGIPSRLLPKDFAIRLVLIIEDVLPSKTQLSLDIGKIRVNGIAIKPQFTDRGCDFPKNMELISSAI